MRKVTKVLSLFIAFFFLPTHAFIPVQAYGMSENAGASLETLQIIDELYYQRGILAQDYSRNLDLIEAVDSQLAALGVENISHSDIMFKLDAEVSPRMSLPSPEEGITWDSYRTIVPHNGKMYEIQVITGVYDGSIDSPLRDSCLYTAF